MPIGLFSGLPQLAGALGGGAGAGAAGAAGAGIGWPLIALSALPSIAQMITGWAGARQGDMTPDWLTEDYNFWSKQASQGLSPEDRSTMRSTYMPGLAAGRTQQQRATTNYLTSIGASGGSDMAMT